MSRRLAAGCALTGLLFIPGTPRSVAAAGPADKSAVATFAREDIATFLRTAKVVASHPIGRGVTGALKVTLSDGALTHDAAFQSVDLNASQFLMRGRLPNNDIQFVDSYRYNLAAYAVADLVGLADMMPVTVERRVDGKRGALTWWADVLMDEGEREARGIEPPSPLDLHYQRQRMTVFAELVRDTDRNKGNVLYTPDWRVLMIDFTRAFRLQKSLRMPGSLQRCDRQLLAQLEALSRASLRGAAGRYLTGFEIDAVLARRDLIVARYHQLIAERGEDVVLY